MQNMSKGNTSYLHEVPYIAKKLLRLHEVVFLATEIEMNLLKLEVLDTRRHVS